MTNYTLSIFDVAERVLSCVERLPEILKEENIPLPSEYDGTRKGGYLALYGGNELLLLGKIGIIPIQEDKIYGNKNEKYKTFAEMKCQSLIETPGSITSDETAFKIKGGLKANNILTIGFSGRLELEDELIVVATIRRCKNLLDENNVFGGNGKLVELSDIKHENPFLTKEIINVICKRINVGF